MNFDRPLRRIVERCLLGMAMAAGSGCVSYLHSVRPPARELMEPCQALPQYSRDHVYIFFIHGTDPANYANLSGLRDYVQALGFRKTYYGQLYHYWQFANEVQRIHKEDPEAHFVLVGFSFGANLVRSITHSVKEEGIVIDLLVYMGGNTLDNIPEDQPENALAIVNILASGCIWNGAQMDRAENLSVPDVWHFGSPTHPKTLETLARHLCEVAATIPVPDLPAQPPLPMEEQAPQPQPLPGTTTSSRQPEWDFLKPASRLRLPQDPEASPEQKPQQPNPLKIAAVPPGGS
jgi:hypothetical protein